MLHDMDPDARDIPEITNCATTDPSDRQAYVPQTTTSKPSNFIDNP